MFVRSERAAERVMASVSGYLERKLRLRVNRAQSAVGLSSQRPFLGLRVVRRGDAVVREVAPKSLERLRKWVRRVTRRSRGVSLAQVLEELRPRLRGWLGDYWRGGREGFWRSLDGWIRRRLRAYQWVLGKHPRGRLRALRRAGVKARACGLAYQESTWRASKAPAMHQALSNRRLEELGYVSLESGYRRRVPA